MSEIKCSVCGATPMESEDIYSDMYGEYRHRHLNQCICFLGARIHTLEWAVRKYDIALKEAEAIMGGEYADFYAHFYGLVEAARESAKEVLK